jgi:hypothetical protein
MGEPLLAGAEGNRARLGAAVVLRDDRSQPVEHRALDVRWARRGRVHDPAQRGEVIARAHPLGHGEQAHEHRGNHLHDRDAMLVDDPQELLGVEARHDRHVHARDRGGQRIHVRRGVVHRRGDHGALTRTELKDPREQRPAGLSLRVGGGCAHDTLRSSGGARRVDDADGCGLRRLRPRLAAGQPLGPEQRTGGRRRLERSWTGRHDDEREAPGHPRRDRRQEIGVHDERLRATVAEHVRDLVAAPVPVDRHGAGTQRHRRDGGLQELDRIAQQQRDPVPGADSELVEPAGRTQRATEQLRIRTEAGVATDAYLLLRWHLADANRPCGARGGFERARARPAHWARSADAGEPSCAATRSTALRKRRK